MTEIEMKLVQARAILIAPFAVYPSLTKAERDVAKLAARGMTTREIAKALSMSDKRVGQCLGIVKRKTGLSKSELPAFIFRQLEETLGLNF